MRNAKLGAATKNIQEVLDADVRYP